MLAKAYKEEFKVNLVFSEDRIIRVEEALEELKNQFSQIKFLLQNFNKFQTYPDWLSKDQALEILQFSSYELKKWVTAGLIETKDATESGKIKRYRKSDCMDFPTALEDYKIRMAIKGEAD